MGFASFGVNVVGTPAGRYPGMSRSIDWGSIFLGSRRIVGIVAGCRRSKPLTPTSATSRSLPAALLRRGTLIPRSATSKSGTVADLALPLAARAVLWREFGARLVYRRPWCWAYGESPLARGEEAGPVVRNRDTGRMGRVMGITVAMN